MHAVGAGALEHVEQGVLVQIAVARRRGADGVRFARHLEIGRAVVGFGIDGDRLDAHFVERAQHARGDGAAVGDDDFINIQ